MFSKDQMDLLLWNRSLIQDVKLAWAPSPKPNRRRNKGKVKILTERIPIFHTWNRCVRNPSRGIKCVWVPAWGEGWLIETVISSTLCWRAPRQRCDRDGPRQAWKWKVPPSHSYKPRFLPTVPAQVSERLGPLQDRTHAKKGNQNTCGKSNEVNKTAQLKECSSLDTWICTCHNNVGQSKDRVSNIK